MPYADHADGELGVHGAFGDAELGGDLGVGEAVDPAQREDLRAARGQGADGLGEDLEFLFMGEFFGGMGLFCYNERGRRLL